MKAPALLDRTHLLAILLAAVLPSSPATRASDCVVGAPNACPGDHVCMNTETGPQCRSIPATAPIPNLVLPVDAATDLVCTHASGVGSHSWPNAFFALDLATPFDQPPAIIRAAADGKAFVFGGEDGKPCPQPPGTPSDAESDDCGESWGNRVKVLHAGGYYSFYVHLERALVSTGELVKQGQAIGIEGWTGAAGHRQVHWSLHRAAGNTLAEQEAHIAWNVDSVPFDYFAVLNGVPQRVHSPGLACPHASIGEAPNQPRLRGIGP